MTNITEWNELCHNKRTLRSIIWNIDGNIQDLSEPASIKTLLFGSYSFDANTNINALNAIIHCVLSSKRFEESLFEWSQEFASKVADQLS